MRLLYKAAMSSSNDSFAESWPYASKIKDSLGATSYETDFACPPRSFRSGRPIKVVTFYSGHGDARRVLERRDGMTLTSKRTGRSYDVVRANPKQTSSAAPRKGAPQFDIDDVLGDLTA